MEEIEKTFAALEVPEGKKVDFAAYVLGEMQTTGGIVLRVWLEDI